VKRKKKLPASRHRVRRDNPAESCVNCGARVARSRMAEHFAHPKCLVGEWRAHMRGIGYAVAGNYVNLAQHAQGFISGSTDGYIVAPVRVSENPFGMNPSVISKKWVPARALEAAMFGLLAGVGDKRERRLIRLLYVRDGALEAAQAAYRLGGKDGLRGYALSLLAQD